VIFSQVIEHIPPEAPDHGRDPAVMKPGGRLIIGTPDYDRMFWVILEYFYNALKPEAYAHEHIAHYTLGSMRQLLRGQRLRARPLPLRRRRRSWSSWRSSDEPRPRALEREAPQGRPHAAVHPAAALPGRL
jgi:hypothetical protein